MNPDMLVEIEVEALCDETPAPPLVPRFEGTVLGRPIQPASFPPVTAKELDEGCLD
ncbi:MAG: hypothetical protein WBG38_17935 [Nodosilinea sp.]